MFGKVKSKIAQSQANNLRNLLPHKIFSVSESQVAGIQNYSDY